MSLLSSFISRLSSSRTMPKPRMQRLREMLDRSWHLGLTSFGGPAVHFQIFNRLFVEKFAWVDVQMYQELFALCQALPGPGSTKMIFGLNVIHGGFVAGALSFFIWSLPGALGMYGLALGVARINNSLPTPVYAVLSGLNAATVGIIALAAVQLAQKAITDKLSRILVFFGGAAGLLYNALWYFPVLLVAGGAVTIMWDLRKEALAKLRGRRSGDVEERTEDQESSALPMSTASSRTSLRSADVAGSVRRVGTPANAETTMQMSEQHPAGSAAATAVSSGRAPANDRFTGTSDPAVRATPESLIFSWRFGVTVVAFFSLTFITIMVLRGVLKDSPRGFALFANLYLAGTIIFGGGPVVIPLLREYIVAEGWVSPRDFLLGLAIIQAFPGPNFNFAVYLGALAASSSPSLPPWAGALIGYLAIFAPGILLFTGTLGIWRAMRRRRSVTSALRGLNATAVGLVYTAVYRLWRIGFLDKGMEGGGSLEADPWWVVVASTAFVGGMWFKLQAPYAIVGGGVGGIIWWGVKGAK